MKKYLLLASLLSSNAFSYTECVVTPNKIFAGDDGAIWVTYQEGGYFNIYKDDPNQKNALTLVTAALMGGNKLAVRFKSDNVPCNQGKSADFGGVWLLAK